MEDNVAIIQMHGGVKEDTKMVSKEVMDMFPGKVYVLTLAPYGGVAYGDTFPFFMFLIKYGGIEFVKELIDFINRKPPTMEATIEYMEDRLFKTSYEHAFLIYIFIAELYDRYYSKYGDIVHDIISVYTKAHPPPNISLRHYNDIYASANIGHLGKEHKECSSLDAKNTMYPSSNILRNARQQFYIDNSIYDTLIKNESIFTLMYSANEASENKKCFDLLKNNPMHFSSYENFTLPMGLYSSIAYEDTPGNTHTLTYQYNEVFTQPPIKTQLYYFKEPGKTTLENILKKYARDAIGDTYIILGSCKALRGRTEETYKSVHPMSSENPPIRVNRLLVPKEKLESIYTTYGRADVPAYTARQTKIRPLSHIHSAYNPYTYTIGDIDTYAERYNKYYRPPISIFSEIPKKLRRPPLQPRLKRIQSRRRNLPVRSITVDPSTVSNTPSLLYILRKSMHHCFPDMYADPDVDTTTTPKKSSWFSLSKLSLWNPQNDIVLFFTRIGGTEMAPRLFFEVNIKGENTLKISNLCSTHLAPLGIKKKERFVKAALNLWVGSNNNNYTIQADIYNKDPYDKDISTSIDKLLHIFTASDGGSLHIKDVDTDYKGGILYKLELPMGSFEQDIDIMPRTIDPSLIRERLERVKAE